MPVSAPSDAGGPMSAVISLPFQRAAQVLIAYRDNFDRALDWADASWLAALLCLDLEQLAQLRHALQGASDAARVTCSRALADAAGAYLPAFDVLAQPLMPKQHGVARPNAALLDALPATHGLQVLRMRALLFRRAEVRRLIDKRTRSQLSEWAGVSVDHLIQDAHMVEAHDTARLNAHATMPSLAALDATLLAVEGWFLVLRDIASVRRLSAAPVTRAPLALLRLALPYALPPLPWLAALPAGLDAMGSMRLFARLPELLPEFAWLFG